MKRLKPYIIIGVLIYAVLSAWRLGTPYIQGVIFANEIEDQARLMNFGSATRARNRIMESARQLKIPITDADLIVVKDEGTRLLLIETQYELPAETPFGLYRHVWRFHPRSEFRMGDVPQPVK